MRHGAGHFSFTLTILLAAAPLGAARAWPDGEGQPLRPIEPSRQTTKPLPYGQLPLGFEANEGQTDQRVRFLARGSGYSLFLTSNEAVLALRRPGGNATQASHSNPAILRAMEPVPAGSRIPNVVARSALIPSRAAELTTNSALTTPESRASNIEPATQAILRMRLVGAKAAAKMTGLGELPGKSNYFLGNDPKKWRTNVRNYTKVKYEKVYPGVDLVYHGNQQQLEYDFVVQPGADPQQIAFQISSAEFKPANAVEAETVRIDRNGDLVVPADGGELRFHKPVVYQPMTYKRQMTAAAGRRVIEANYVLRGGERIGFQLADYDRKRPVIIDPTLVYSSYLGGSSDDLGSAVAVDALGNAYVTGETFSADFPTTSGAFQSVKPGDVSNAFVTKLNAAGSAVVYSTYLGGNDLNGVSGRGIAVDASGNAYVRGFTNSIDFPTTPGAFQRTFGGGEDAFVTKLNASGSALVYSTYLGGSGFDGGFDGGGIAIDAAGNAYVTGTTTSGDFPTTPGAFQTTPGDGFGRVQDAFVSKLNAAGSALVYSTYLGATDTGGFGIAVDAKGNAFVAGFTNSADFPTTPGAFQTTYGGLGEAFVTKLNIAGSGLLYSTYLGGSGGARATAIAVDAAGNAFVTGHTSNTNFPTTLGAFQTTCGGCNLGTDSGDAFITKLNPSGSALVYSTFLGGSGDEAGNGIAIDASGNAYVTGFTNSGDFPTTRAAFQAAYGGGVSDAFVSKLNAAGSALVYSTYLGGNDIDNGTGIALRRERAERHDQTALQQTQNDDRFDDETASGNTYVTGYSFSSNFPTTPGAFQTIFGGVADAFVAKIATLAFAGRPGKANCHGKSVSALVRQFGGLNNAAATLGFVSVQALQDAIREFCEG
jgi:hypothetical protein